MHQIDEKIRKRIMEFQRNEITEYFIYKKLSHLAKDGNNSEVMSKIAEEEFRHYNIWKKYSGEDVKPDNLKRLYYIIISSVFGVTFGIKLMEKSETGAQESYSAFSNVVPEAEEIQKQESDHENQLINMINEEKLKYMGSMVLGLNDALVEFTGALAGFTFALQNSRLIAVTGLIMGLSASFSMAASEYLSTKTEAGERNPLKASLYTGTAYVFTVTAMISPYFLFPNCYYALIATLICAVLLIVVFTFYMSVVKEISFKSRFFEMFVISMGVALLSFIIGIIARQTLKIEI